MRPSALAQRGGSKSPPALCAQGETRTLLHGCEVWCLQCQRQVHHALGCFDSVVRTNCEELQHGTQQVRSTAAVEGGDRMKADSMSWAAMAGLQRGAAMEHRACQQLWRAEQELLWCGVGVVQR